MEFYQSPLSDVIRAVRANPEKGLTARAAAARHKTYGPNTLPRGKKTAWWQFFFRQFRSPLVYILLIAAVLTAFLQEYADMAVILLAVLVNVAVGFWQEFQSSNILARLQEIVRITALVIRDGAIHEIESSNLVPGDIIILKSGMKVPADARLLSAKNLEVSEAILTGESKAVTKKAGDIPKKDVSIGDRKNMVHMGTAVEKGEGRAVVVATNKNTEIGKIALLTQKAHDARTPLQQRIARLGKFITILVAIAAVVIFVIGIIEEYSFEEMFTTAIAVAVAAIPEGLPAAISIVLAVAAQRILRQRGVTKGLLSAETLGSTSVICTDKTGTLTEGRMKVEKLLVPDEEHARVILALANEAIVERTGTEFVVRGETTDQAKMQAFLDAGGNLDELLSRMPRVAFLPFDPEYTFIASVHNTDNGTLVFLTGAPEAILSRCALPEEKRKEYDRQYEELAKKGFRMIALAEKKIYAVPNNISIGGEDNCNDIDLADHETRERIIQNLSFVGFAAIRDPIRPDVKASIKAAAHAGVTPIMLTGDHTLTARSIGKELGFPSEPDAVMEGTALDSLTDEELAARITNIHIFARVTPRHKMRIIEAWRAHGKVVAMTGDGVNDAPALKSADIGVALGSGTDVAKEASDLILLNNSFSIIVAAIRQGRIAFNNIKKVTIFLLAGSLTELILILSALILKTPLPVTAVQILWTNLVEDTLPNIALAFEPGEKDVMERQPLQKKEPILDAEGKIIVFIVGVITDLILLAVFLGLYYYSSWSLRHIQTFVFMALGIDTFFYIYSIKSLRYPIFSYNIFSNPYLIWATIIGIGVMLGAVYIPFFNTLLGTIPLPISDWPALLLLGIIEIVGVEIVKWFFFRRNFSIAKTNA